jgi:hypothetical protein
VTLRHLIWDGQAAAPPSARTSAVRCRCGAADDNPRRRRRGRAYTAVIDDRVRFRRSASVGGCLGLTRRRYRLPVPRQWKVIQTVREKFSCRSCETITQLPAPFHVIPRGHVGPSLLAMILYAKFGEHQPLNRQSEA